MSLEDHPIASIFPLVGENDLAQLATDIKANGMSVPIVIFEGKILDGRNRYRAAQRVGAKIPQVTYSGTEPVKHVLSLNLHRRHLSESQRAMVAAKIANMSVGQPKKYSADLRNTPPAISQSQAAGILSVSVRSVQKAQSVIRNVPAEIAAVERGETTVNAIDEKLKAERRAATPPAIPAPVTPPAPMPQSVSPSVKPPPAPPVKREVYRSSNGMQYARLAIDNLKKIQPSDTEREQALLAVKQYIESNLPRK